MRVFRVWPKRMKRSNGQIISPEMVVVVTMSTHASTPFVNGAKELKDMYRSMYHCDLSKLAINPGDFNYTILA